MPLYLTQDNGRRCGVEKAFIAPARGRDTLTIYKYAHVSKVFEMREFSSKFSDLGYQ